MGAMAERLKALDLKSSDSEKGPWVRIPLAPLNKRSNPNRLERFFYAKYPTEP